MCKINEKTFVKKIAELNGKRIAVEIEGIVRIEAECCNITYANGIVKMSDKANKNVITINLSFAHTILANDENSEFHVFCDNDILFIIEQLSGEKE